MIHLRSTHLPVHHGYGLILHRHGLDLVMIEAIGREVQQFARHDLHFPENLCGACAVVSYTMKEVLKRLGEKSTFVRGVYTGVKSHCWLRWHYYVLDLSAEQYSDHPDPKRMLYRRWAGYESTAYNEVMVGEAALELVRQNWGDESPVAYEGRIQQFADNMAEAVELVLQAKRRLKRHEEEEEGHGEACAR